MNILIIGGGDIATEGIIPVLGGQVVSYQDCDIRDIDHLFSIVALHTPDVVICTAGVSHVALILDSNPHDWVEEIQVNLIGSYNVAKVATDLGVPTMIFLASVAGLYGKPEHSGYSASKAGVISLVQSLGMEGFNAYAISPGRVNTKMRERDYPGENPKTRLDPTQIGQVVKEILDGKHNPGDNIIIRKRGFRTLRRKDRGMPWRTYLRVGEPPVI